MSQHEVEAIDADAIDDALSISVAQKQETPSTADVFLYKDGWQLGIIIGTMETFNMGTEINRSTSGFIRSKTVEGIRMTAMSGWTCKPKSPLVLDPAKYTVLVQAVAKQLNFDLPPDRWDNGNKGPPTEEQKGRFKACHIEKKLSVWWVRKTLKTFLKTRDLGRMSELKNIQLPEQFRAAKVYLDHDPCDHLGGCLNWLDRLYTETGIRFETERIPSFVKAERAKANFVFGDEDVPAQRPAAKAGPRKLASNPTEKGGVLHTSPPKPVSPLHFDSTNSFRPPPFSPVRTYPHLSSWGEPAERRSWRRFENCAKPATTKLSEEEARQFYQLSPAARNAVASPMLPGLTSSFRTPLWQLNKAPPFPALRPAPAPLAAPALVAAPAPLVTPKLPPLSSMATRVSHLDTEFSGGTRRLEVRLQQMDAQRRRQYKRVPMSSEVSSGFRVSAMTREKHGSRIQDAQNRLDLRRYAYHNRAFPTEGSVRRYPQTQPRRVSKSEQLRKKSIFAQAFENRHAQMRLAEYE
ncbi:hypothetical protein B0T16DRAFT_493645 [Cercophora newfieldiana]|uniref:Single-strand DNA deaminase toxin A-like C-terminal domain-containing protein n=1 Tax=Cercophora newfieldiana TaxID=92897 RepID=A0AA40CRD9_9PEZI|nr:hypothetical protein B0T16DRAFT_493645 [Cercophora newfieldiana]